MNERNWEYKGLQLSNNSNPYNFQVENVDNTVVYDGKIYTNGNSDGVYSSNIVTGARYFDFSGRLYGTKAQIEEAYKKLKEVVKSEDFPSIYNRGFYDLKWTDKRGNDVHIQAKVYKPLITKESAGNMLEFNFTLLADDPFYRSQEETTETGGLGMFGGNTLGNTMPNYLDSGINAITVTNQGDKKAGIYIQILGSLDNPRITNTTTGQSLKILQSTAILEVDNRVKPFIITENGVNIKASKRGEFVYLAPGENQIVVSSEGGDTDISVLIKFSDTFE